MRITTKPERSKMYVNYNKNTIVRNNVRFKIEQKCPKENNTSCV